VNFVSITVMLYNILVTLFAAVLFEFWKARYLVRSSNKLGILQSFSWGVCQRKKKNIFNCSKFVFTYNRDVGTVSRARGENRPAE